MNPSEACPGVNDWSRLIENQVDAATRQRLELHRASCPKCDGEVALLESFLRAEATPAERNDVAWITAQMPQAAVQQPRPWWTSLWPGQAWRTWALAAAALAAVAVGLQWRSGLPVVPQSIESSQLRGGALQIETPLGDLPSAPASLRWNKVDGAVRYQVEISAVDGEVLWSVSLTNQAFYDQIPVGLFVPRKSLRLRVIAFDANGQTVSESGYVAARVVPPGGSK